MVPVRCFFSCPAIVSPACGDATQRIPLYSCSMPAWYQAASLFLRQFSKLDLPNPSCDLQWLLRSMWCQAMVGKLALWLASPQPHTKLASSWLLFTGHTILITHSSVGQFARDPRWNPLPESPKQPNQICHSNVHAVLPASLSLHIASSLDLKVVAVWQLA